MIKENKNEEAKDAWLEDEGGQGSSFFEKNKTFIGLGVVALLLVAFIFWPSSSKQEAPAPSPKVGMFDKARGRYESLSGSEKTFWQATGVITTVALGALAYKKWPESGLWQSIKDGGSKISQWFSSKTPKTSHTAQQEGSAQTVKVEGQEELIAEMKNFRKDLNSDVSQSKKDMKHTQGLFGNAMSNTETINRNTISLKDEFELFGKKVGDISKEIKQAGKKVDSFTSDLGEKAGNFEKNLTAKAEDFSESLKKKIDEVNAGMSKEVSEKIDAMKQDVSDLQQSLSDFKQEIGNKLSEIAKSNQNQPG